MNYGNLRNWHSTDIIKQYMEDYGLSDSWRMRNPFLREYSYFSTVHQCSSRIDLFIISNSLITKISDNTIHSIVISDHAPISLSINTQTYAKTSIIWRFNNSLLEDSNFITLIRQEWAFFLEMNDSPDTSPSLLWETGKAVIRGKIISYSSYQQQELENILEQKIKFLTNDISRHPSEPKQKELKELKTQIDDIIQKKKTQFQIQQLKFNGFQYSNKANSKYLANLLQYKKEKSIIPAILDAAGNINQNPQDINNIFRNFYSNLYSPTHQPTQSEIDTFLNSLTLPKLTAEQTNILDAPLTLNELTKALNKIPSNKSPGPDGLPAEFYRHFWDILSPLFNRVIIEIKRSSTIPTHMNTAAMTLLLKPNKDPSHPSSYRPLSLLNTDLKIITKALATRIETVTPTLIHPDQTGFIRNRYATDNVRRLFNLFNISQERQHKTIIISLNAEKAFDKVNWSFFYSIHFTSLVLESHSSIGLKYCTHHPGPPLLLTESLHRVSHCIRAPDRDAHSRLLSSQFSLNHSQQQ